MKAHIETLALVLLLAIAAVTGLGCIHRHQIKVCSERPHTHQGAPALPSVPCDTDTDCFEKYGREY